MIAIEIFFVLVLVGLAVGLVRQHRMRRLAHGHKGDAVKTPEEIRSHQSHR